MLRYIHTKLLAAMGSVSALAIAPVLWSLLALNMILKSPDLPGVPLARDSLSICLYRYAGCVLLACGATAAILMVCKADPPTFLRALFRYLRHNLKPFLIVSVLGHVLALPFFYKSFDAVGIVLTNLLALGLIPIITAALGTIFQLPGLRRAPAWIRWDPPGTDIYNVSALFLVLVSLALYALLTFDTINPRHWSGEDLDASRFLTGLGWSVAFAVTWAATLRGTSEWPSSDSGDAGSGSISHLTLAGHYRHIEQDRKTDASDTLPAGSGGSAGAGAPRDLEKNLDRIEVLFVRVALVQFLALFLWLAVCLAASSAAPDWDLGRASAKILGDFGNLPQALPQAGWLRLSALATILVLPSFIAYYALNVATRRYDERAAKHGSALRSNDWNDLLAFLEPLCATVIGVVLLEAVDISVLGVEWGAPEGVGEAHLFRYPWALLLVVPLVYAAVFGLKFTSMFVGIRRRDLNAYFQKLQKVFESPLCRRPRRDAESPQTLQDYGLKEQDAGAIAQFEHYDPGLHDKFYSYYANLRERAILYLRFSADWPFFVSYRNVSVGTGGSSQDGQGAASYLVPLENGKLEDAGTRLAGVNFRSDPATIRATFHRYLICYPRYAEKLPHDSYIWREIERGIHLSLTGGLWFKLKRHMTLALGSSCLARSEEEAWQEFRLLTRGFLSLEKGAGFTDVVRRLSGVTGAVSWEELRIALTPESARQAWRDLLFPVCPHVLDTDTMARGLKSDLLDADGFPNGPRTIQPAAEDKLLILLVPKSPELLTPLSFTNPVWPDCGSITADYAEQVHRRFTAILNDIGGRQSRRAFSRGIYANGFVLHYSPDGSVAS